MNLSRRFLPWTWCRTWRPSRCILHRGHFGRHGASSAGGFGIDWFDGKREGTP